MDHAIPSSPIKNVSGMHYKCRESASPSQQINEFVFVIQFKKWQTLDPNMARKSLVGGKCIRKKKTSCRDICSILELDVICDWSESFFSDHSFSISTQWWAKCVLRRLLNKTMWPTNCSIQMWYFLLGETFTLPWTWWCNFPAGVRSKCI